MIVKPNPLSWVNVAGGVAGLNADRQIVGPVITRNDTEANLDAITFDAGELAVQTDTLALRFGYDDTNDASLYPGLQPAGGDDSYWIGSDFTDSDPDYSWSSGHYNEQSGYSNTQSGYYNEQSGGSNTQSGGSNTQGGYSNTQSGYYNEQSGYNNIQGGYNNSQSGYYNIQGGYSNVQGGDYGLQVGRDVEDGDYDYCYLLGETKTAGVGHAVYLWVNNGVRFKPVSAAPSSPEKGTVYYDSDDDKLLVYTGAAWETITSAV